MAVQPGPTKRLDVHSAPDGTRWLSKWKGGKHRTKKAILNAVCQSCCHHYELSGTQLNEYAEALASSGTLRRAIDVLDLWANSGDPKSGNAAAQMRYNRDRAERDARWLDQDITVSQCLCPICNSDQVLVESPR